MFKSLFIITMLTAISAQARETIVCSLSETAKPKNSVSVTADLKELPEDGYFTGQDGLDVGKENYSFDLQLVKEKLTETKKNKKRENKYTLNVTFYENNKVQDEVSSRSWIVDLNKARYRKTFAKEPMLDEEGKKIMDFVCRYNKK